MDNENQEKISDQSEKRTSRADNSSKKRSQYAKQRKEFNKAGNDDRAKRDSRDPRGKNGVPWKNDWRYYALSEQIAKDFGSLPYNRIPGVPARVTAAVASGDSTDPGVTGSGLSSAQSVMVLHYAPTAGTAISLLQKTSGINMAATQLYTYIRHVNSGATNYEPADVMMYVLGMADIYSTYLQCRRALGIVQSYSIENRNLPDTLLRALNVDSADLRANIAQYRGRLNVLQKKIDAFAVPKYFKAFERAAYISSLIFADSDSIRGQFYVFRKSVYYIWSTTSSEQGTELVAKDMPVYSTSAVLPTFASYLDILSEQIDAMYLDTDANTMSGDILKAFKESELYSLMPTDEAYQVFPVFDEDILAQIENSYCALNGLHKSSASLFTFSIADAFTGSSANIQQTSGVIAYKPAFARSSSAAFQDWNIKSKYFNSHKDNPDFKDNLEWSRLITTMEESITGGNIINTITGCGLELLLYYSTYYYNGQSYSISAFTNLINDANVTATVSIRIMQFDWHPILYSVAGTVAGSELSITSFEVGADLKKYTVVEDATIEAIHDAANAAAYYSSDITSATNRKYK